jgi:hypothetical protein
MRIFIFVLVMFIIGCFENKTEDKSKQLAAAAVLSQLGKSTGTTSSACTSNFNCTSAPSFSTLASAGTTTSCAQSGCHTTASQQSGLDITDYNSTRAFTNPGNPCSSRMYTAITTGAMAGNSNSSINQAVFCWIAGGSSR